MVIAHRPHIVLFIGQWLSVWPGCQSGPKRCCTCLQFLQCSGCVLTAVPASQLLFQCHPPLPDPPSSSCSVITICPSTTSPHTSVPSRVSPCYFALRWSILRQITPDHLRLPGNESGILTPQDAGLKFLLITSYRISWVGSRPEGSTPFYSISHLSAQTFTPTLHSLVFFSPHTVHFVFLSALLALDHGGFMEELTTLRSKY